MFHYTLCSFGWQLNISFSGTFDVQYVSVTSHGMDAGYVDVVCYFASGSLAKGCKINAILVKGHKELLTCEQIVTRKREKSVSVSIALPEGEYKLLVSDVEAVSNDELPNPAFLTQITVENSSVTGIYMYIHWLYQTILFSSCH